MRSVRRCCSLHVLHLNLGLIEKTLAELSRIEDPLTILGDGLEPDIVVQL